MARVAGPHSTAKPFARGAPARIESRRPLRRELGPVVGAWGVDDDAVERRRDWEFKMRFFIGFEIEPLVARSGRRLASLDGKSGDGPLSAASRDHVVACR
jgi:hypothetical protein